jgi:hypothetical protein
MSNRIELTGKEMMQGCNVGVFRMIENHKRGRRAEARIGHAAKYEDHWRNHIEGALGEMALAKYLGVYWSGVGRLATPDIGTNIEVRTSKYESGEMPIHPTDDDESNFWFLVGQYGDYRIAGFMRGGQAKRDDWWKDKNDNKRFAFWVPQSELSL